MLFDHKFYITYYSDIKDFNYLDSCNHYLTYGIKENRLFNKNLIHFDHKFYTTNYSDLKNLNYLKMI